MRIWKVLLIIIILMCPMPSSAEETSTEGILNSYSEMYGDIFEEGLNSIEGENVFLNTIPDFSPHDILKRLNSGEFVISAKELTTYVLRLLLGEVYDSAKLMAIILVLAVLCSYLSSLKSGFADSTIADCAFYVCYIIISGVAAAAFYSAAESASETVSNIAFFMRIIVPVMITALMTSGAIISATTLEPVLLSIVEATVWIIDAVFVPAVMISTALNVVNGMSDKFKTDRMVSLLNNSVKWGLSILLTIFVSLAGLNSIASSGVDGLTVKLSKFAAANLIPMVGGILSESVETVMSCSVVIKNSVGILGVICLVAIALGPALKIAAVLILFRITAAVAEPISEPKIITCISRLAGSVSSLFSMIAAVTVMFILVITIMINAGSSAVLLGR